MIKSNLKYLLWLTVVVSFLPPVPLAAFGTEKSAERATTATADASDEGTEAYCGISVGPLDPVLTAQLPDVTDKGRGVVVQKVMKGSPADHAGLQRYDIVVGYDAQDVYSPEQLVKLVRNDRPGREVSLAYVRGGNVKTTKLTLSEMPATTEVRSLRGEGIRDRAAIGNLEREHASQERERQSDPKPWTTFESLTVTKLADGRYKAEIDFHNEKKELVHREYTGTRDELCQAIEKDEQLPKEVREHLLRSVDQQTPRRLTLDLPKALRDFFDLDVEYFNWPHLDF